MLPKPSHGNNWTLSQKAFWAKPPWEYFAEGFAKAERHPLLKSPGAFGGPKHFAKLWKIWQYGGNWVVSYGAGLSLRDLGPIRISLGHLDDSWVSIFEHPWQWVSNIVADARDVINRKGKRIYEINPSYFANLPWVIQNVSQSHVVALNCEFPVLQVVFEIFRPKIIAIASSSIAGLLRSCLFNSLETKYRHHNSGVTAPQDRTHSRWSAECTFCGRQASAALDCLIEAASADQKIAAGLVSNRMLLLFVLENLLAEKCGQSSGWISQGRLLYQI